MLTLVFKCFTVYDFGEVLRELETLRYFLKRNWQVAPVNLQSFICSILVCISSRMTEKMQPSGLESNYLDESECENCGSKYSAEFYEFPRN